MKLDKRIIDGKKPLTAFDVMESKFIGTDCYFSDKASDYGDLSNCQIGRLLSRDGMTGVFNATKNNSYANFNYCLPCEWVKPEEPEKKYRVLTLNEFLEKFKIGDAIYIRFKKDGAERVVVFSEYNIPPHKDEGNNTESVCLNGIEHHLKSIVCLGMREYNLTTLFDCYEYFDGKEWQPFGIEIGEKE